jgi:hypothetical protein
LINPWNISIDRYINVSDKSDEIVESIDTPPQEWFGLNLKYVPILEGKLFHQYDHRYASYIARSDETVDLTDKAPDVRVRCYRYISPSTALRRNPFLTEVNGLLSIRNITNRTNERGVIAAIIPPCATDYSVRVVKVLDKDPIKTVLLLSIFNSLIFDYLARQRLGGTNLSNYILEQTPVPLPTLFSKKELEFVIPRVLELIYTSYDLRSFAKDLGYNNEPFKWNEDRRAQIRAELDAYYARVYGLSRDELRYILDPQEVYGENFLGETFRVLKDKDIRLYGEYRTRRLILEAWDKIN